ncbi:MAG: methionyl-tRNA formyltransferase [Lachnospiraceae bacterium]|nr:methionyl-tRNA formyltransferase [Lachnospiraceae bacterium]
MKIVFMGTPDFSVETLKQIIAAGHEVSLVVTQPDRPRGRGKKPSYSPVKEFAVEHNIPCFQPEKIRDESCIEILERENADIFVVVAFGQILPQRILDIPKYGCMNVHASLLPAYRGAAPIQWSVINGDPETGVTTMRMDAGMDTGDILLQERIRIAPDETGGSLFDKLAAAGGALCVKTLEQIQDGSIHPIRQNHEAATYTRMISKKDGQIDFSLPARQIECLIRGMNPWPSAYTYIDQKILKLWNADVIIPKEQYEPGEVFDVTKDSFCVAAGKDALKILSLQLEGKKRMDTADFLRGFSLKNGDRLG